MLFHIMLYSGQQESGSVGIASRGNDGQITFRDWHPVGAEEYGYVAPDPLNSNIIYGGKISKYNKLTGQVQNITPKATTKLGSIVLYAQNLLSFLLLIIKLYILQEMFYSKPRWWKQLAGNQP